MDLILSYDLINAERAHSKGGVASITEPKNRSIATDSPQFEKLQDDDYAPEAPCEVELTDGRTLRVFWNASIFDKDKGNIKALLEGPCVLATIDAFGRHDLIMRSEPTVDGRLGVTVSNRNGKVLLLGLGDVISDDKGSFFTAQGQEVYQWRKASPSSCAHTNYAVKNPGTGARQK